MKEKATEIKNRNIKADVIRGFAIITVVLGHCIQNGNGWDYFINSMYWSNKLYQFIYSFHMPLFMLLAGWFAYFSMKKLEGDRKKQWRFLGKRAFTYITPIFLWTVFEYVRGYILNKGQGYEGVGFSEFAISFLSYFLTNLWFLWAILICLIIVFFMHFYLNDNVLLYMFGFLLLWIIPDAANLGVYKYLMPYYIGAFYINKLLNKRHPDKNDVREPQKEPAETGDNADISGRIYGIVTRFTDGYKEKPVRYLIISAVLFALLFLFYNEKAFIYLTGYRLVRSNWYKQIVIDVYRFVIGLVGSAFFMMLWDRLVEKAGDYKWPVLRTFGVNSLGVYILQGYYILIVMASYTNNMTGIRWYHIPIETIIICAVSLISAIILGKIPFLRILVGKAGEKNGK